MSNADWKNAKGQGDAGRGGECAAESLKSLIAHIADQITDADLRHTDMLRQMQARLASLGIEARSIRDRVPGEYVPAFDRIEEGMQLLADRIANAHDHRTTPVMPQAPAQTVAQPVMTEPAAAMNAAAARPMAAASPALAEVAAAAAPTSPSDDPWDREQAEALSRLYDSGETGLRGGLADPDADQFASEDSLAGSLGRGGASLDVEREWLEDRFAEIAQRVEQSLAEIRPESSFLALGHRFEQFEQRMGSVLEDVATRSDVEGLRLIEAHISELTQHLEQTQIQLERLDGIETQLNAVVERLSDDRNGTAADVAALPVAQIDEIVSQAADRVASQLAQMHLSGGSQAGLQVETIAARAAEQAVSRFAADYREPRQDETDGMHGLRALLEGFNRERRQGEEHTATVLDTMQQAIIRVLDRVDAIELQHHQSPVPAAPREYVREQVRFAADPRETADLGAMRAAADSGKSMANAAAHFAADLQPQPSRLSQSAPQIANASAIPSPFAHQPGADWNRGTIPDDARAGASMRQPESEPLAEPMSGAPNGTMRGPRAGVDKLRQDFIADAQRAKLRAQSETIPAPVAPTDAATLSQPKAAPARVAAPKAKPDAKADAKADAGPVAAKTAAGLPVKKLLVGALGLVILFQGANLLLARRKADGSIVPPSATLTKSTPPATAAATSSGKEKDKAAAAKAMPGAAGAAPSMVNPSAAPVEDGAAPGTEMRPTSEGVSGLSQDGARAATSTDGKAPAGALPADASESRAGTSEPKPGANPAKGKSASGSGAFKLPNTPQKPHSVPETVIEDLNYNGAPIEPRIDATIAAAQASSDVPVGISVQTPARPLTPYDLARLQQRHQMATMSSKLGIAAANATPAALLPEKLSPSTGNVAAALAQQAAAQKSALDLPPLTVGPLSLRLAAAKGDPSAEFEVGARLAEGKSTDQSFKEAVKWYTRSANQGFAQAQYRLGTLYERGLGVKADAGRARVWYTRAAEQGNIKAMHNLAVLNAGGKSGSPDYTSAAQWFGEAAVLGLSDSQFNLAVLHESGLGVAKDLGMAYQWFSIAARSGDKEAVRRRDLAKAQLPITDVVAVDERVKTWLPKSSDKLVNDARVAGEAWKQRATDEENG